MGIENAMKLRALPAADILEKMLAFSTDFFNDRTIKIRIRTNIPQQAALECAANKLINDNRIVALQDKIKSNSFVEISLFEIIQEINHDHLKIVYATNDFITATLTYGLSNNSEYPQSIDPLIIVQKLHEHFTFVTRRELLNSLLSDQERELAALREAAISDLQAHTSRLDHTLTEQMIKDREHVRTITQELDQRYKNKEDALEKQHATRLADVEKKEQELRQKQKDFDARENTTVRRELLGKITKLIQDHKSVTISKETTRKRLIIHAICLYAMIGAIGLAAAFAWKLIAFPNPDPRFLFPLSAGILTFVSTLIFYLRWTDHWFKEHSHAEFQNQKFAADILRASWVAELFFEGDTKEGVQLPPELLGSFTRGLFVDNYASSNKHHPIDNLLDFASKFQKIKLDKTGCEITSNQPSQNQN